MILRIISPLLFLFISFSVYGKSDPRHNSSTISDDLKQNADAVVRLEDINCNIEKNKTTVSYRYIITVLNHRGINEAKIRIPYASFSKVKTPSGTIYKADGKKFKSIKNADVIDVSAIAGYSLYEDSRIIYYEPPIKTTPFTIEYEYEQVFKGNLFLPSWSAFKGYNVAIEKSIFNVNVQKDIDFKYREQAVLEKASIRQNEEGTSYSWSVSNIYAPKSEPYDVDIYRQFPSVFTAINNFEFYDTEGNLNTWQDFGQWITALNENKQELPEATKQKIKDLVAEAKTDREKTELVYKYMQERTHYLNIAIGIGGWQPIEAGRVDEVGYGDCKALSNYTKSLLDVAGIQSHYTIIKAGSSIPDFKTDFVSSQFNHVILCVPNNGDTIWLECTSQKIPPGYLSTFTDDRYALLIDGTNSKLIKTPALHGFLNGERRKATVNINPDLSATFRVQAYYGGQYENEIGWWQSDDDELVKRKTYENLSFSNVKLNNYNFTARQDLNSIEENLDFTVSSLGNKMGKRLVLEVNQLNRESYSPKKVFNRRSDVLVQRSMIESDTIYYILPKGYVLEANVKPIEIKSDFGSYVAKVEYHGNTLTYIRNARVNKGLYNKSKYSDFVAFFQDIKSADLQKVLLKQTD